jgi:hypothetical protein
LAVCWAALLQYSIKQVLRKQSKKNEMYCLLGIMVQFHGLWQRWPRSNMRTCFKRLWNCLLLSADFQTIYSLAIKYFILLGYNFCQWISIQNSQQSISTLWSLSHI